MIDVDGREVPLTNPGRVLWPATGTTKRDVVEYYRAIAPALVAHVAGRPLMLGRWPSGVEGRGFGQLECRGRPPWMRTARLALLAGRDVDACVVDDAAGLVWLANQGVIELHPYLARADAPDRPVAVVFDLDPGPPAGLLACARVALALRALLASLGLASFAKTTGGSGIHVLVPLNGSATFAQAKAFGRSVAERLARELPELVVERMSRALRGGRVLIDRSPNDARKQTIAAYSLRAAREPLVSAPLEWRELEDAAARDDARSLVLGPAAVLSRWRERGDALAAAATLRQEIPS